MVASPHRDVTPPTGEFVSILMLTHNAPSYVENSVRSVARDTDEVAYELVVLDNASDEPTRSLLSALAAEGLIDKLLLLDRNSLFAEGNNLAAELTSPEATHFLLLNSDIEVRSTDWLRHLLDVHQRGITAYGLAFGPTRVDGYCLLIDADIYRDFGLDENHQWFWAVTELQAKVLNAGLAVRGYAEHERYLHHFGGKSGASFVGARGMDVDREQIYAWFAGKTPEVIDRRADGTVPGEPASLGRMGRLARRWKRMLTARRAGP